MTKSNYDYTVRRKFPALDKKWKVFFFHGNTLAASPNEAQ